MSASSPASGLWCVRDSVSRMASSNPTAPAAVDDTDALVHERNGVLTLAVSTAGAGNSLDDAALTLDVATQLTVDERLIPTGRETSTHDFSGGLPLEGVSLDTCFTDIGVTDGRWRASVTSGSRTTTLWADASAYRYVQTFTGDGLPEPKNRRSGLAVEPMTCPANAFNTGEGLLTLAPGETWSAPFGITGA